PELSLLPVTIETAVFVFYRTNLFQLLGRWSGLYPLPRGFCHAVRDRCADLSFQLVMCFPHLVCSTGSWNRNRRSCQGSQFGFNHTKHPGLRVARIRVFNYAALYSQAASNASSRVSLSPITAPNGEAGMEHPS